MKTQLVVLCLGLLLVASAMAVPEHHDLKARFNSYMSKHGHRFAGNEYTRRFAIYSANMRKAARLSALDGHATYGETKFSHMTDKEFASIYLPRTYGPEFFPMESVLEMSEAAVPTSVDWRTHNPPVVNPIKDQGQCGSCWTFSAISVVESQWALSGHSLVSLSEQSIVDCSKDICVEYENQQVCMAGCDGGLPWGAYQYMIKAGGVDSETSYPYKAVDGKCKFSPTNVLAKISNYTMVNPTVADIKSALASKGPVSVALNAGFLQTYTGGIAHPKDCSPDEIDHAVVVVGYGTDASAGDYWIVRNSWGVSWGEEGYFRLKTGYCGIEKYPSLPIV